MRIDAIRNCRMAYSAPKTSSSHSLPKKNETQLNTLNQDSVSFHATKSVTSGFSNATKGIALGGGLGYLTITALAATSGLALPIAASALYAAAFGVAGGLAGKSLDDAEKNSEVKIAKSNGFRIAA